jgi:hypothetical protein
MVCETCMPENLTSCFECQIVFPDSPTSIPVQTFHPVFTSQTHVHLDEQSQGAHLASIPISIFDHVACNELRQDNVPGHKTARLHDFNLSGAASQPHIDNTTPHVVDVLKACLQQVGVDQSQTDYVIQNVKMRLDHAVNKSPPTHDDPACISTDTKANPTHMGDKRDKRKEKHASIGGKTSGKSLMICNLPCRLHQDDLIKAIESMGFAGLFEKVHIPCRQSDSNLGYGFVHFLQRKHAERFAAAFEGYRFTHKGSTKVCTVKVADCQGNGRNRRLPRNLRLAQCGC